MSREERGLLKEITLVYNIRQHTQGKEVQKMPQARPPKDYLSAAEVKKILGITDGMLYNFVDNGALQRIIPPGRKQGVYRRSQVEQLARDLQVFISTREEDKITFSKATKEDLPACIEIGTSSYPNIQQQITPLEPRLKWFDKNPDMYYIIRRGEEVVGYTTIMPLKLERIQGILEGKEDLKDITPDDIEKFEPGKPLSVYVATMRTKPNITKSEKRAYGVRLIGGLLTTLIKFIDEGIDLDTLYARSETVDGIRALKHMRFKEIPSSTHYKNYDLKVNSPEAQQLLKRYKEAITKRNMPKDKFKELVASY